MSKDIHIIVHPKPIHKNCDKCIIVFPRHFQTDGSIFLPLNFTSFFIIRGKIVVHDLSYLGREFQNHHAVVRRYQIRGKGVRFGTINKICWHLGCDVGDILKFDGTLEGNDEA